MTAKINGETSVTLFSLLCTLILIHRYHILGNARCQDGSGYRSFLAVSWKKPGKCDLSSSEVNDECPRK